MQSSLQVLNSLRISIMLFEIDIWYAYVVTWEYYREKTEKDKGRVKYI